MMTLCCNGATEGAVKKWKREIETEKESPASNILRLQLAI